MNETPQSQLQSPVELLIGYHGTDQKYKSSILFSGFNASTGNAHWMGDGVYFFLEGLKNPASLAEEWVALQSRHGKGTDYLVVFKATLNAETQKTLKLYNQEGIEFFTKFREDVIKKLNQAGSYCKDDLLDGFLINMLIKTSETALDIVIGDFYTKNRFERNNVIRSRIPNARIAVVKNNAIIVKVTVHSSKRYRNNGQLI